MRLFLLVLTTITVACTTDPKPIRYTFTVKTAYRTRAENCERDITALFAKLIPSIVTDCYQSHDDILCQDNDCRIDLVGFCRTSARLLVQDQIQKCTDGEANWVDVPSETSTRSLRARVSGQSDRF